MRYFDGGHRAYQPLGQPKSGVGGTGMTKSEVVDAFIRGDLDRRGFIKKLTAVGVSSAAAMAYATTLVQDVAASPSGNGTGFITRGFLQDEDYGLAVPIEDVPAAIAALASETDEIADTLSALIANFTPADFTDAGLDDADAEVLETIQSQLLEQAAAIAAFTGAPAAAEQAETSVDVATGTLVEGLTVVAQELNELASGYAALIPALEDPEARELFTQIAIAVGRFAALVSYMAGLDPVPSAFEQPVAPTDVDD